MSFSTKSYETYVSIRENIGDVWIALKVCNYDLHSWSPSNAEILVSANNKCYSADIFSGDEKETILKFGEFVHELKTGEWSDTLRFGIKLSEESPMMEEEEDV